MRTKNKISLIHKSLYGIMLLGLFLATVSTPGFSTARAQQVATAVPTTHTHEVDTLTPTPDISRNLPGIVGGDQATPGEWPWQVAIVFNSATNIYNGFTCGGSLVGYQWVLTATHCVIHRDKDGHKIGYLRPDEIDIIAGIYDLKTPASGYQRRHVSQIIVNDLNYSDVPDDNDITLLKLDSLITIGGSGATRTAIIPLVPSTIGSLIGIDSWVTGWGKTTPLIIPTPTPQPSQTPPPSQLVSQFLLKVQLPIRANAICNDSSHYNGHITDNMLCAGLDAGGHDFCNGDSGGPLVIDNGGGGNWNLAGIVSFSGVSRSMNMDCAVPNLEGVYTRVSRYVDWIRSYVPLCGALLNITTQGGGTATSFGSNTSGCPYREVTSGPTVTLMAPADSGWSFSHWIGASGGASTNYTVTGPATVTAVFTQDGGSDTTPPTGSWTSPGNGQTISARTVNLTVNASDNSGGSGVREVRWSAKWNNQWSNIGADSVSPYSITWDMCTSDVPNGDVELGMEVWDNANNQWVYSEHYTNYHINKNYTCTANGTTNWSTKYYNGHDHWSDTNNFNGQMCEETINSIGLEKNYGSAAPCNNGVYDNWVAEYNGTINFAPGNYVFQVQNDDGLKMWANGADVVSRGGSDSPSYACPAHYFSGNVPIRVILNEEAGDAQVKIGWTTDTSVCNLPDVFNKANPSDGTAFQLTSPVLEWGSSNGQKDYAYCVDTSNNNNCDTGWQGVGNVTSTSLSNLAVGTYYWQVRAQNVGGETYANNNTWWSFTVQPESTVPSANFEAFSLSGMAPLTTTFHILNMANITYCFWDYGDGQTSETCTEIHDHTYTNTGSYTVALWVNGPNGHDFTSQTDYINVLPPPDTEPPTVSWTVPTTDKQVYDVANQIIPLGVGASDNVGISSVVFSRWDYANQVYVNIGTISMSPYRVNFDTSALLPGWNEIDANAYDSAGNSAFSYIFLNHVSPITKTISSVAAQDGWILELSETSNAGGALNSSATTFYLGDDATKKQYRGILSFSTGASLPDNAVITGVTLKVRQQAILGGGNPVTMFQGFMFDVKNGFFGSASTLQTGDFQAAASATYGPSAPAPVGGWYSFNLTGAKLFVNKLATGFGLTQIRLRFKLDDNNNAIANYLSLYSGNVTTAAYRPQLVITYYLP
ncbi:MAG: trypsin-like serine protease [Anaerolineales bacterium]